MLLDTAALIDIMQGDPAIEPIKEEIDASGTAHISTISIMELFDGIHRVARPGSERANVVSLLESMRELPVDRDVAMQAGATRAEFAQRDEETAVNLQDLLIGCTAICHDMPVVTANIDDFEEIGGVEVRGY